MSVRARGYPRISAWVACLCAFLVRVQMSVILLSLNAEELCCASLGVNLGMSLGVNWLSILSGLGCMVYLSI